MVEIIFKRERHQVFPAMGAKNVYSLPSKGLTARAAALVEKIVRDHIEKVVAPNTPSTITLKKKKVIRVRRFLCFYKKVEVEITEESTSVRYVVDDFRRRSFVGPRKVKITYCAKYGAVSDEFRFEAYDASDDACFSVGPEDGLPELVPLTKAQAIVLTNGGGDDWDEVVWGVQADLDDLKKYPHLR